MDEKSSGCLENSAQHGSLSNMYKLNVKSAQPVHSMHNLKSNSQMLNFQHYIYTTAMMYKIIPVERKKNTTLCTFCAILKILYNGINLFKCILAKKKSGKTDMV